jgi:hypothetical protein
MNDRSGAWAGMRSMEANGGFVTRAVLRTCRQGVLVADRK